MARDRVAEIGEIRARKGNFGAKYRAEAAIFSCKKVIDAEGRGEFIEFIPIRIVTALEVFTRECVAELIDSGEPYISRARDIVKNLKFDFEITRSLVDKRVSFGELASHVMSFNSISDIDFVLSVLTDTPFDKLLESVTKRWNVEILGEPADPIVSDVPALRASIQRIFEVRHVLVHEMPELEPFSKYEIEKFIESGLNFTEALGEVVGTLIHGQYPLTQLEMNEQAQESANIADEKLAIFLNKIDPGKRAKRFQISQKIWEQFRESESVYLSRMDKDRAERGSIAPLIYWGTWEEITLERINWIERHFETSERVDGMEPLD